MNALKPRWISRLSGRWLARWSRRPAEDDTFAAGLLDLLEESVVICRPDGRISEWNRAAERIYGWRKTDIVGRRLADLFDEAPWVESPAGVDVVRKKAGGGSVTVRLQRTRRPAGDWVETGLDLTAQRQAASEADAKHRHYHNVLHAMPASDAFFSDMFHGSAFAAWHLDARDAWAIFHDLQARGVTDLRAELEAHPDLVFRLMAGIKIVDVNDTALRLFEAPDRKEMVGATIAPFWFPDHRLETLIGSLSDAFDGIPTFRGLGRMRTLAGNEIHVLFTRSASTALSNAGQVLLAIVDITDRVQAETALADMQANLAHAARIASLGELTASIAHEVNQPLAAITANGEAALRWLDRPMADLGKIRGLTGDMIADARRAADIVAHVRTMASPQVGHHEDLSINTLAEEALAVLGAQMDKCGVTAVRRFQADLPTVLGDPVQLQQVIVNLVLNAAQAMKGVAGSRVSLCTSGGGEGVVLTVTDNGPGIDRENLDRLFGSFFTTKSDGMGIGLAICRTIVEAHGGSITAESPPTGGARFIVGLPPSVRQASRTEDEDSLGQRKAQRHREARGMRGRDQFLGIGARRLSEARR